LKKKLRIALAQINVTVGALEENARKITSALKRARKLSADLVLFPELALTGYPPEDLLFKSCFIRDNEAALRRVAAASRGITAIVGFVDRDRRGHLYNAAAVMSGGKVTARYHKMMLPNYGVFDEKRYFTPGMSPLTLSLSPKGRGRGEGKIGISICEDIWVENGPWLAEAKAGASLLVNISASPYHAGKLHLRERLVSRRALKCRSWICYLNLVGGQDELVFDGGSLVADPTGKIRFRAPQFKEGLYLTQIPLGSKSGAGRPSRPLPADEEIFQALVLGLRDYVRKNGFSRVVIGMSGGIDSALTACIAGAALGPAAVTAVSMPSRFSSQGTRRDARRVSEALGIQFFEIPIERMLEAALGTLKQGMGRMPEGVTAENLQARIRGTLLMAFSNWFGWLVLSTGNKSEVSTGYCTLYGDMVGGFAVLKDVPKTWVYRLSRTANRFFKKRVIPSSTFTRPPTAELKPNQKDQDTLPPYGRLDRIVKAYVEERRPAAQIRRRIPSAKTDVARVIRMIDSNEYKRRQAAPGIKITPLAFGRDRRMPITNHYRES